MSPQKPTATAGPTKISRYFFQDIDFPKFLKLAAALGLLVAAIQTLSDLNIQPNQPFSVYDALRLVFLYSSCCLMGMIFAEKIRLEGFLFRRRASRRRKGLLLFLAGILPGLTIGIVYHWQFGDYRFSRHVPFWIRQLGSPYDVFILSLRAALSEEVTFRFLLFTAFFYILRRLFQPLAERGFGLARWIPVLFSAVSSSLLFGGVHGTYGFITAFVAGIVLCGAFLGGGLESAVTAHFLANFVFFSLTYLH